jgi:hypothetical protein
MNKIEIEIPVDKEVDWEASAEQKQIVFKDKQFTYEDMCQKLLKGTYCYVGAGGYIWADGKNENCRIDPNNAKTTHQLECILAKNKLANVARYLNGNWKPGKTNLGHFDAYVLFLTPEKDYIGCIHILDCAHNSNILFKSYELAKQAVEILGEETVKLALEPLY